TMGMVTANFEWLAWPFLMLLAMVFAPHYLNMRISTMPEFVRRRFGPHAAEFLSWYALLATVVSWLGATLYVGSLLLSQIMGWPLWVSAVALMSVATFLTVAGGLAVVIVTDSFQSILMIAGAAIMAAIGFSHVGGLDRLLEAVPADRWALLRPTNDPDFPWHAMLLGYPVIGIWFWCTDQTIVQRVLGARNLTQGQRGALFTGFLKIVTPFIFILPGIFCFVLHPNLADPNTAFMTMVSNYLPAGMVGLIVAVLIAALVSTIDSGLNSFSTIFTLDIYVRRFRPDASPRHIKTVGRLVTIVTAAVAIGLALALTRSQRDLFSLLQSIIGYFAPPMAAVFLIGVLWRRATSTAALSTLVIGSAASLTIGFMDIFHYPSKGYWPHFLLMAFYLFAGMCAFMIVVSLLTRHAACEEALPTPAEAYRVSGTRTRGVWLGWAVLGAIMLGLYVLFD
ncbi:MAG: sodium/solute symporter, partial [Phycisphaerae bacterium]|nr:sodium/solute symporter [Phycisphaerae bacterium]